MNTVPQKEQYAKAVCFFLAEQLRVRRIGLDRAAEIAQKVVDNLNLIDTEQDFLRFIKELSKDFDELFQLEERISMSIHISKRKELEGKVREFVVNILPADTATALQILQEAIRDEIKIEDLTMKFPQFRQFLEKNQR
jgi:hypothetical protein